MSLRNFEEVIRDASGGNSKVQKGEYLSSGLYPIIDQGQEFIGGFTNDPSNLVKGEGPWIVFGDHTRALKFVDFPFCLGADGVKVLQLLRPLEADLKYVCHFLQFANIPSAGYSRHYKFLKRLQILLPPLDEQKRIAAILDKADQLRQKRRQAIALLDSLTQSIFLEMFGALTRKIRLEEVCARITDGTHQAPNWSVDGVPFLFVSNIRNQNISFETNKYVSGEEYLRLTKNCPIEAGDVLYTAVGSYGNAAVVPPGKTFVFQRHIAHIKPYVERINPVFLARALESDTVRQQADRVARGVAQKTVTLASLREFEIPLPKIEDQKLFERRISKVRLLAMGNQSDHLDNLFSALQHRAFSGQL